MKCYNICQLKSHYISLVNFLGDFAYAAKYLCCFSCCSGAGWNPPILEDLREQGAGPGARADTPTDRAERVAAARPGGRQAPLLCLHLHIHPDGHNHVTLITVVHPYLYSRVSISRPNLIFYIRMVISILVAIFMVHWLLWFVCTVEFRFHGQI